MTNEPNKFLTQRSKLSISPSYLKMKWLSLLFLVYYLLDFNKEAFFSLKFCHKPPHTVLSPCKRHFQFLLLFLEEVIFGSLSKSLKKPPNRTISLFILKEIFNKYFFFFSTNFHSFKRENFRHQISQFPICEDLYKKITPKCTRVV